MRLGLSPQEAAEDAILRIAAVAPHFTGALFALRADGKHAGAAFNWVFQYTVRAEGDDKARVFTVQPLREGGAEQRMARRPRALLRAWPGPALVAATAASAFAAGGACAWMLAALRTAAAAAALQAAAKPNVCASDAL